MKREDYFKIMDCVSEDDLAEMMKYHRSKASPFRGERIIMTTTAMHSEQTRSGGKKSKGIAAIVAAALVCANVAGGYWLLHGNNGITSRSNPSSGASMQTEPLEVLTTKPNETAQTKEYVKRMQQYFTARNGKPCDFNFTGYGKDFNVSWEDEDYQITLRAVVGCEWVLYYFYDVTPKKGQSFEQFTSEHPQMLLMSTEDTNAAQCHEMGRYIDGGTGNVTALDNGVWHCSGMVINETNKPFYQADQPLQLAAQMMYSDKLGGAVPCGALDFITKSHPMEKAESPLNIADICGSDADAFIGDVTEDVLLTKIAATPFGVFYRSADYATGRDATSEFNISAERTGKDLWSLVPSDSYQFDDERGNISDYSRIGIQVVQDAAGSNGMYMYMDLLFEQPALPVDAKFAVQSTKPNASASAEDAPPITMHPAAALVSPDSSVTENNSDAPQYVQRMQAYFADVSGQPCSYDFTGCGKDFDISWENSDYKMTLRAITGCEWILYYFYDIEPKKGQNWEQFLWDYPTIDLCIDGSTMSFAQTKLYTSVPEVSLGDDLPLDNGVWHFCGMTHNPTSEPFYQDGDAMAFRVWANSGHGKSEEVYTATLDFFSKSYPMQPLESPLKVADLCTPDEYWTLNDGVNDELLLTEKAVTPFGAFFLSDTVQSVEHEQEVCYPIIDRFTDQFPEISTLSRIGKAPVDAQSRIYMNLIFNSPFQSENN